MHETIFNNAFIRPSECDAHSSVGWVPFVHLDMNVRKGLEDGQRQRADVTVQKATAQCAAYSVKSLLVQKHLAM